MIIKKNLLLLAVFFFPLAILAQTGTIRGTVKNEAGQPVPQAQIKLQGTNILTNTDSVGNFEIKDLPYGTKTLIIGDMRTVTAVEQVELDTNIATVTITARPSADESLRRGEKTQVRPQRHPYSPGRERSH